MAGFNRSWTKPLLMTALIAGAGLIVCAQSKPNGALTGKHLREMLLTVAVDPGNTEHLAGPKVERDLAERCLTHEALGRERAHIEHGRV